MPRKLFEYVKERWVCNGTSFGGGNDYRETLVSNRSGSSYQSRPARQQNRESYAVQNEQRPQVVREWSGHKTTLATVKPFEYEGKIWCVKVPTGSFVAVRNGQAFTTGNSGFPKSQNVSKAIDKSGGRSRMHLEAKESLAREITACREAAGVSRRELSSWFPEYSAVTANWERLDAGFRVPSESAYKVLIDCLGIEDNWRDMVRAEDMRRKYGGVTSNRRGDNTVYGLGHSGTEYQSTTDAAKQWDGWGTALKPALEPITVARKPLTGTVAANVVEHGTGAINIDGCRVGNEMITSLPSRNSDNHHFAQDEWTKTSAIGEKRTYEGRFPANLIHDGSDEVIDLFPVTGASKATPRNNGEFKSVAKGRESPQVTFGHNDNGGSAARFFYCAKANKKDRNEGLEDIDAKSTANKGNGLSRVCLKCGISQRGDEVCQDEDNCPKEWVNPPKKNNHLTVKPTDLMCYLVRLVTPPNGTVLDPFMGSGSTGKACMTEGFNFVGIELDPDYIEIARARIEAAKPDNTLNNFIDWE